MISIFIKKLIIFAIFYLFCFQIFAQCETVNSTFKTGEKFEYDVYYNLGFIWLNVGKVIFEISSEKHQNKDVYLLIAKGFSHKKYYWIYEMRDQYNSYIDKKTLKPLKFIRDTYGDGHVVKNNYVFDYEKNKIYSDCYNSEDGKRKDTFVVNSCIYDVLSAMYNARNYDFNIPVNKKVPFELISENEIFTVYGKYLGDENIELKDSTKHDCMKFSSELLQGSMFSGKDELIVWLSKDKNHIPIKVETNVLVGSVKVYLAAAKNLRY